MIKRIPLHLVALSIFLGIVFWIGHSSQLVARGEILPASSANNDSSDQGGCPQASIVIRDGWSLKFIVTPSDGLEVFDVTYDGVELLKSVKTVNWHADYGSTGFRLSTGCESSGGGFPIYSYGDTQVIDLLDGQNNVIGFEVVQDFRMVSWPTMICNYRFDQRIQFFTDGRFRTVHGMYGRGCSESMNGTYRPITRIDIAVNGDANDSFAYYENNDWVDLTTEDYRVPYSEIGHGPHDLTMENYSWLVKDSGNTGFYIEQDIGQFPQEPPSQGASPFLYVTLHHPDEGDEDIPIVGECCNDNHIQGPEQFVDGENIQNQNIVIWYVPQFEAEIMSPPYYCWAEPDGPNEGIYPCFAGPMFHPFPTDSLIYLPIVKNND